MLTGFPPLADQRARVLILGSMPGVASLQAQQYYGHGRNLFWDLVEQWFGVPRTAPYAERCQALLEHRIAVWDVLQNCRRAGSLDSAIRQPQANDFATFYAQHPQLRAVFFNGSAAEQLYRKLVAPTLTNAAPLQFQRLPSTSPANASQRPEQKRARWQAVLQALHG